MDELYDFLFVNPGKGFGRFLTKVVDKGIIDAVLVDGSAKGVSALGRVMARWQTGYVRNYVMSIFVGVIVVSAYFFLR